MFIFSTGMPVKRYLSNKYLTLLITSVCGCNLITNWHFKEPRRLHIAPGNVLGVYWYINTAYYCMHTVYYPLGLTSNVAR